MKVFVIWYDNGEPYEDNFQDIHAIFATRELAEAYLDSNFEKFIPDYGNREPYWRDKKYICSQGKTNSVDCQTCSKYYDSDNYDGTIFIDEDGEQTNECPEECYLEDNYITYFGCYANYRIKEFKVFNSTKDIDNEVEVDGAEVKEIEEETLDQIIASKPYSTQGVELNSKSVNKKIGYNILSDEAMKDIGFRKSGEGENQHWYFCKKLEGRNINGIDYSVTFNVTLPIPVNNDNLAIDVLDEAFLQPYDFQSILNRNPKLAYPGEIADAFEEQMEYLADKGVIYGHKRGEYV